MPLISDSIGRVLGKRYRLLSALGTGASAHVFLAEDVSLQRHVAVKVLQPGLASDEAFLKRFGAEHSARSPRPQPPTRVAGVRLGGEDTDGPYLVLEYLGGGSLRRPARPGCPPEPLRRPPISAPKAVPKALAYLHMHEAWCTGTSSRPNLLFDEEEPRSEVADFGVAPRPGGGGLYGAGRSHGGNSPLHFARVGRGKAAGRPAATVASLALVLYLRALSGTVPFVDRYDDGHPHGPASDPPLPLRMPRSVPSTTCLPALPPRRPPPGWMRPASAARLGALSSALPDARAARPVILLTTSPLRHLVNGLPGTGHLPS